MPSKSFLVLICLVVITAILAAPGFAQSEWTQRDTTVFMGGIGHFSHKYVGGTAYSLGIGLYGWVNMGWSHSSWSVPTYYGPMPKIDYSSDDGYIEITPFKGVSKQFSATGGLALLIGSSTGMSSLGFAATVYGKFAPVPSTILMIRFSQGLIKPDQNAPTTSQTTFGGGIGFKPTKFILLTGTVDRTQSEGHGTTQLMFGLGFMVGKSASSDQSIDPW